VNGVTDCCIVLRFHNGNLAMNDIHYSALDPCPEPCARPWVDANLYTGIHAGVQAQL